MHTREHQCNHPAQISCREDTLHTRNWHQHSTGAGSHIHPPYQHPAQERGELRSQCGSLNGEHRGTQSGAQTTCRSHRQASLTPLARQDLSQTTPCEASALGNAEQRQPDLPRSRFTDDQVHTMIQGALRKISSHPHAQVSWGETKLHVPDISRITQHSRSHCFINAHTETRCGSPSKNRTCLPHAQGQAKSPHCRHAHWKR